jgi:glucose-1-phosphatase
MSRITLVCFDWGGVILKICRSWAEGCAAAGLDVRGESSTTEWAARRKPIAKAFEVGEFGEDEFFERMAASMDRLYSPEEIERIHAAWLLREYDGVAEIVARLHATPTVETALLSNTNPHHWSRRHEAGSGHASRGDGSSVDALAVHAERAQARRPHFPTAGTLRHQHASHLLGVAKPDARIYEEFARRVGRRPEEILFFDDLPDNIATARSLGWDAVQVDHTGDTAAQISAELARRSILD